MAMQPAQSMSPMSSMPSMTPASFQQTAQTYGPEASYQEQADATSASYASSPYGPPAAAALYSTPQASASAAGTPPATIKLDDLMAQLTLPAQADEFAATGLNVTA